MAYPNYGGYPAPGGYGAPPQQQHYGAPPPQAGGYGGGYGAPPPQPGYGGYGAPPGAPPPGGGFAPPPGPPASHHHGHHHGHHAPQYGAPPPQQGGTLMYLETPIPAPPPAPPAQPPPGYNAFGDVERIRKACKGFGTDEKAIIETLAPLDAFQINALSAAYISTTGKSLLSQLEGETSGWFEGALRAKVLGPVGYDAWLVHRACDGAGTHEDILNEVLLMRTNQEMYTLKEAYRSIYGKRMEDVVSGDLSLKTKRLFTMALQGSRMEDHLPVDPGMVQHDIKELKSAARGAGTDEIKICGILTSRSTPHLQAISHQYGSSLSKMISSEFSGHMKDALLYITESLTSNPPGVARDAALLEESMKGMGTKDERLIYRLFRAHWNRQRFEMVKRIYRDTQSKRGLAKRIDGETSGDYKRFLLAVVGHD